MNFSIPLWGLIFAYSLPFAILWTLTSKVDCPTSVPCQVTLQGTRDLPLRGREECINSCVSRIRLVLSYLHWLLAIISGSLLLIYLSRSRRSNDPEENII